MGDCRIRFQVSGALLRRLAVTTGTGQHQEAERPGSRDEEPRSADTSQPNPRRDDVDEESTSAPVVLVEAKNYASDTTVRELLESLSIPSALLVAPSGSPTADVDVPPTAVRGLDLLESGKARLWDCTRFPPADITSWPLKVYSERQGRNSRTLYDAGWFPGGTLLMLPFEQESANAWSNGDARYDDPQYNRAASSVPPATQPALVQLLRGSAAAAAAVPASHGGSSTTRPTPSQVLSSVPERFESDASEDDETRHRRDEAALTERRKNQQRKRAAVEARHAKLEARIRILDEASDKNRTVSEQVQRMLIKSRATGRADLKLHDRFYVRCVLVVVDDGGTTTTTSTTTSAATEQFRYVSRQDTVGRILSSFASPARPMSLSSELLVVRRSSSSSSNTTTYRRLPALRRVHELVSDGHLSEFDRVVVRWYDPATEEDGPTPSVDDEDDNDEDDAPDHNDDSAGHAVMNSTLPLEAALTGSLHEGNAPMSTGELTLGLPPPSDLSTTLTIPVPAPLADAFYLRLHDAIVAFESKVRGNRATPGSAARSRNSGSASAVKVRHMQMKGRAMGDKNRVKVEDRFYVDLVIIIGNEGSADASMRVLDSSPVFLSKSDPLHRLIRDFVLASKLPALHNPSISAARPPAQVDLLVPTLSSGAADDPASSLFRRLVDTDSTFLDAERDGLLHNFDRIVAYVHY